MSIVSIVILSSVCMTTVQWYDDFLLATRNGAPCAFCRTVTEAKRSGAVTGIGSLCQFGSCNLVVNFLLQLFPQFIVASMLDSKYKHVTSIFFWESYIAPTLATVTTGDCYDIFHFA